LTEFLEKILETLTLI